MVIFPNKGSFQITTITQDDRAFVIPFFEQLYKNAQNYIEFDNLLTHEIGLHRVQYIPDTETQGRIHTATVLINYIDSFNNCNCKKYPKIRLYNLAQKYIYDYKLDKSYYNFDFENIIKSNLLDIYNDYKLLV